VKHEAQQRGRSGGNVRIGRARQCEELHLGFDEALLRDIPHRGEKLAL
jgi:hypothetical protein